MSPASKMQIEHFQTNLLEYKTEIDAAIASCVKRESRDTLKQYGANSKLVTDTFFEILQRGGKRIRGGLVMASYKMFGGTDHKLALQAAQAIEMLQAYILIFDDIQDRSDTRRGGLAAHKLLAQHHQKQHLAGNGEHIGVALALNAALSGGHAAQVLLATLPCSDATRTQILKLVNQTMITTAHGQTHDIMNEIVADVDQQAVDRVLQWKTAHYTFLNPIKVGMLLAGVDSDSQAVYDFAMHAGRVFQITDDVLGTFGAEQESGKSPMDDIREGKRTLLSVYALQHAPMADQNFLLQMLGKQRLSPAEFERCKHIIDSSGALSFARGEASNHAEQALAALDDFDLECNQEGIDFLRGLTTYMLTRTA